MTTTRKKPKPIHKGVAYPGQVSLAKELADKVCTEINERAPKINADTPYKQQGTLEYLIQILQSRV